MFRHKGLIRGRTLESATSLNACTQRWSTANIHDFELKVTSFCSRKGIKIQYGLLHVNIKACYTLSLTDLFVSMSIQLLAELLHENTCSHSFTAVYIIEESTEEEWGQQDCSCFKTSTGVFRPHSNRWRVHANMVHKVINRQRMKVQFCSHQNKIKNHINCGPINAKKTLYIETCCRLTVVVCS